MSKRDFKNLIRVKSLCDDLMNVEDTVKKQAIKLIDTPVDNDTKDTPLHIAAKSDQLDLCLRLLGHGVHFEKANADQQSAFENAKIGSDSHRILGIIRNEREFCGNDNSSKDDKELETFVSRMLEYENDEYKSIMNAKDNLNMDFVTYCFSLQNPKLAQAIVKIVYYKSLCVQKLLLPSTSAIKPTLDNLRKANESLRSIIDSETNENTDDILKIRSSVQQYFESMLSRSVSFLGLFKEPKSGRYVHNGFTQIVRRMLAVAVSNTPTVSHKEHFDENPCIGGMWKQQLDENEVDKLKETMENLRGILQAAVLKPAEGMLRTHEIMSQMKVPAPRREKIGKNAQVDSQNRNIKKKKMITFEGLEKEECTGYLFFGAVDQFKFSLIDYVLMRNSDPNDRASTILAINNLLKCCPVTKRIYAQIKTQYDLDEKQSILHFAAKAGLQEQLVVMLDVCPNTALHFKDSNGDEMVMTAIKASKVDISRLLLDKGAHLYIESSNGDTVLHAATHTENVHLVSMVLRGLKMQSQWQEQFQQILDRRNEKGQAAIHLAYAAGDVEIVKLLFCYGCIYDQLDQKLNRAKSYIRDQKGPVADLYTYMEKMFTSLTDSESQKKTLQSIFELSPDDKLLYYGVRAHEDKGHAKSLLGHVMHYNSVNTDRPLTIAIINNLLTCYPLSQKSYAEIKAKYRLDDEQSALHKAAQEGLEEDLVAILRACPDVIQNLKDSSGDTPIMSATKATNLDIVRVLFAHGADMMVADDRGNTLLHAALRTKNYDLTNYVLEGVRLASKSLEDFHKMIDRKNNEGQAPVHIAYCTDDVKLVKLLYCYGCTYDQPGAQSYISNSEGPVANLYQKIGRVFGMVDNSNNREQVVQLIAGLDPQDCLVYCHVRARRHAANTEPLTLKQAMGEEDGEAANRINKSHQQARKEWGLTKAEKTVREFARRLPAKLAAESSCLLCCSSRVRAAVQSVAESSNPSS